MRLELELAARVGALDVDVELSTEAPLVLIGPNGAGKSTLLLLLLGVRRPTRGRIVLGDRVLYDSGRGLDAPPERRRLGYVPQSYGLFPHLTVMENVRFALAGRVPRGERRARAAALLDALEIGALADRRPLSLSAGEAQRVALARALAAEPEALLLDEPMAALDATVRQKVRVFLGARLRALGLPALLVTHDPADAAVVGAPIAVMEAGRIVQRGTLAEVSAAPASAFVAGWLGGSLPRQP